MKQSAIDLKMMARCVELSAQAASERELPFACVVCRDGAILAEATNAVVRESDVTRHAELIAISQAQRALGRSDLSGCTLYSTVEPCPMCAFPIREARIGRVIYAIGSPMMGGVSKWNVLTDDELSNAMPQVFGDPPLVAAGLCYDEAAAVWRDWNPLIWAGIRLCGCLAPADGGATIVYAPRKRGLPRRALDLIRSVMGRRRGRRAEAEPETESVL